MAEQKTFVRRKRMFLPLLVFSAAVVIIFTLFVNMGEVTPTVHIAPAAPTPSTNGFDYFIAAGHAIVNEQNRGEAERKSLGMHFNPLDSRYSLAEKAVILHNNQAALSKFRAGLAYPCARPRSETLDGGVADSFMLMDIAYMLALDGQVKSACGDWGGAVDSELDAVTMGQMAVRGSGISGMLFATQSRPFVTRMIWESVDHLNAEQAKRAVARLEKIAALHVSYADVMREQKAYGQTMMLNSWRRANWRDDFAASYKPMTAHFLGSDLVNRFRMNSLSKRRAMRDYSKLCDREIALAGKPYNGAAEARVAREDYVSEALFSYDPNYRDARLVDVMAQTVTSLLMTALALRAYRVEHGRYPYALSELVPRELAAVPADPFAFNAALKYQKTGSAYVLYSIGPDGKDDGGKPALGSRNGAGKWSYIVKQGDLGDVVAGINRW